MQDRFVGDKGDFEKYFLLRNLCSDQLKLGVNWCLVEPDAKEKKKNVGMNVGYLQNENTDYREADTSLFDTLKKITLPLDNNKRNLASIENKEVLPDGTVFFLRPFQNIQARKECSGIKTAFNTSKVAI